MAAAFDGHANVVRILMNAHADIHAQDKVIMYYHDPLFIAFIVLFIQNCTQDGWTALHLTSQEGHEEVVRVLIKANARINQRSKVFSHMGTIFCV